MSLNIKNGDQLIPVAGTPKVTKSSLELDKVENKTSAEIRDELTLDNVKNAMGDAYLDKTELLSTISASSTTQIRDSKTVEFDGTGKAVEKLVVEGKTSQDGTPTPSAPVEVKGVGDGGWNIMPFAKKETKSLNGVTIASDGLGTYTLSGTATADTFITFNIDEFVTVKSIGNNGTGCLYLFNNKTFAASSTIALDFMYKSQKVDGWSFTFFNRVSYDYNVLGEKQVDAIRFHISPNITTNFLCKPMMTNDGKTDHEFIPYGKYKIPISSGGKSTNIYLNAPILNGYSINTAKPEQGCGVAVFTDGSKWTKQATNTFAFDGISNGDVLNTDTSLFACTHFKCVNGTSELGIRFKQSAGSTTVYVVDPSGVFKNDIATFSTFINTQAQNGTPVTWYYPLATKETFDAPEIATVVGKNTLTVGTEVTPASISVTSFGDYYSKVEVDKILTPKRITDITSGIAKTDGNLFTKFDIAWANIVYTEHSVSIDIRISGTINTVIKSQAWAKILDLHFISNDIPLPYGTIVGNCYHSGYPSKNLIVNLDNLGGLHIVSTGNTLNDMIDDSNITLSISYIV